MKAFLLDRWLRYCGSLEVDHNDPPVEALLVNGCSQVFLYRGPDAFGNRQYREATARVIVQPIERPRPREKAEIVAVQEEPEPEPAGISRRARTRMEEPRRRRADTHRSGTGNAGWSSGSSPGS